MKLIVGLGNPGLSFKKTRHNIGFMVLDNFANTHGIEINKKKFKGLYSDLEINNEKIILLKPQSYMNLSGEVVKNFVDYFKIDIEDILIINDDLDLSFCKIRLKYDSSSAGHKGLKNIETTLNTKEYKRLKIGIANNREIETKDYVLGKFSKNEMDEIEKTLSITNQLLLDYINIDFDKLMNKYN